MLMIRLQRVGRKNHAEFRAVVTEKTRAAKSSNYVELVGHYNPHTNEANFNEKRIKYWISVGAKVSDTFHNLLVSQKIIKGKKINVLPKKSPIVKEEEETSEKEDNPSEAETVEKVETKTKKEDNNKKEQDNSKEEESKKEEENKD